MPGPPCARPGPKIPAQGGWSAARSGLRAQCHALSRKFAAPASKRLSGLSRAGYSRLHQGTPERKSGSQSLRSTTAGPIEMGPAVTIAGLPDLSLPVPRAAWDHGSHACRAAPAARCDLLPPGLAADSFIQRRTTHHEQAEPSFLFHADPARDLPGLPCGRRGPTSFALNPCAAERSPCAQTPNPYCPLSRGNGYRANMRPRRSLNLRIGMPISM